MNAVPRATVVTSPVELTVATPGNEELYVTTAFGIGACTLSLTAVRNWNVLPTPTSVSPGLDTRYRDVGMVSITRTATNALAVPLVSCTWVEPTPTEVTTPPALTRTIAESTLVNAGAPGTT